MKLRRLGAAVVTAAAIGFVPFGVNASPVTFDFTVMGTGGPLNGVKETGSFTFDSGLEAPNALDLTAGLFTALNFTWDGITYSATTANTGLLEFDSSGKLDLAIFGSDCGAGTCVVKAGTEGWSVDGSAFEYTVPSSLDLFFGTLSIAPAPSSVPETLTLSLFTAGLLGAAATRKARQQSPKRAVETKTAASVDAGSAPRIERLRLGAASQRPRGKQRCFISLSAFPAVTRQNADGRRTTRIVALTVDSDWFSQATRSPSLERMTTRRLERSRSILKDS